MSGVMYPFTVDLDNGPLGDVFWTLEEAVLAARAVEWGTSRHVVRIARANETILDGEKLKQALKLW